METLNKELSVLQQTACNVNILGQNERKNNTFDHLDWWSGHAWFIKWFYRVGIVFVEWRTIAVFISNLFHIPFFPFDLILYVVLSVRNVKSSTVVKYDRFNKTCFIDGRWKYLVFFPPQCWLLLAAHVANSPQIKLNIQIDKVVHATFKFTDSRQSNQTYPRQHEILHYWWRTQVITQKNIKTRSQ